jgi:hypothetical protein
MSNYAFIAGLPATGKTALAAKIAKDLEMEHIEIDKWIEELRSDPKLAPWVDFFNQKDEADYWQKTDPTTHWQNLKNQAEALWPAILERISQVKQKPEKVLFESSIILPHIAHRDLNFPGVFLLGESEEKILETIKQDPRWGKTSELQAQEAKNWFRFERLIIKTEAEIYNYKTFNELAGAEKELRWMLK